MVVKVVSNNYDIYTEEFPISSNIPFILLTYNIYFKFIGAIDNRFVWFAFAFYRDHVEVYYDRALVGRFLTNNRL